MRRAGKPPRRGWCRPPRPPWWTACTWSRPAWKPSSVPKPRRATGWGCAAWSAPGACTPASPTPGWWMHRGVCRPPCRAAMWGRAWSRCCNPGLTPRWMVPGPCTVMNRRPPAAGPPTPMPCWGQHRCCWGMSACTPGTICWCRWMRRPRWRGPGRVSAPVCCAKACRWWRWWASLPGWCTAPGYGAWSTWRPPPPPWARDSGWPAPACASPMSWAASARRLTAWPMPCNSNTSICTPWPMPRLRCCGHPAWTRAATGSTNAGCRSPGAAWHRSGETAGPRVCTPKISHAAWTPTPRHSKRGSRSRWSTACAATMACTAGCWTKACPGWMRRVRLPVSSAPASTSPKPKSWRPRCWPKPTISACWWSTPPASFPCSIPRASASTPTPHSAPCWAQTAPSKVSCPGKMSTPMI